MRLLVIAFASLVVNVVFWLRYRGLEYLSSAAIRQPEIQKDLILLILSVILLLDALRHLRGRQPAVVEGEIDRTLEADPEVEDQLDDLLQQREQFQAEIRRAREELGFMSRRLQTVSEERDGLRAALQKLESWSVQNDIRPAEGETAGTAAALPLNRGLRI